MSTPYRLRDPRGPHAWDVLRGSDHDRGPDGLSKEAGLGSLFKPLLNAGRKLWQGTNRAGNWVAAHPRTSIGLTAAAAPAVYKAPAAATALYDVAMLEPQRAANIAMEQKNQALAAQSRRVAAATAAKNAPPPAPDQLAAGAGKFRDLITQNWPAVAGAGIGLGGLGLWLKQRADRRREEEEEDLLGRMPAKAAAARLVDEFPVQVGFLARCGERGLSGPEIREAIEKCAAISDGLAEDWTRFFAGAAGLEAGAPSEVVKAAGLDDTFAAVAGKKPPLAQPAQPVNPAAPWAGNKPRPQPATVPIKAPPPAPAATLATPGAQPAPPTPPVAPQAPAVPSAPMGRGEAGTAALNWRPTQAQERAHYAGYAKQKGYQMGTHTLDEGAQLQVGDIDPATRRRFLGVREETSPAGMWGGAQTSTKPIWDEPIPEDLGEQGKFMGESWRQVKPPSTYTHDYDETTGRPRVTRTGTADMPLEVARAIEQKQHAGAAQRGAREYGAHDESAVNQYLGATTEQLGKDEATRAWYEQQKPRLLQEIAEKNEIDPESPLAESMYQQQLRGDLSLMSKPEEDTQGAAHGRMWGQVPGAMGAVAAAPFAWAGDAYNAAAGNPDKGWARGAWAEFTDPLTKGLGIDPMRSQSGAKGLFEGEARSKAMPRAPTRYEMAEGIVPGQGPGPSATSLSQDKAREWKDYAEQQTNPYAGMGANFAGGLWERAPELASLAGIGGLRAAGAKGGGWLAQQAAKIPALAPFVSRLPVAGSAMQSVQRLAGTLPGAQRVGQVASAVAQSPLGRQVGRAGQAISQTAAPEVAKHVSRFGGPGMVGFEAVQTGIDAAKGDYGGKPGAAAAADQVQAQQVDFAKHLGMADINGQYDPNADVDTHDMPAKDIKSWMTPERSQAMSQLRDADRDEFQGMIQGLPPELTDRLSQGQPLTPQDMEALKAAGQDPAHIQAVGKRLAKVTPILLAHNEFNGDMEAAQRFMNSEEAPATAAERNSSLVESGQKKVESGEAASLTDGIGAVWNGMDDMGKMLTFGGMAVGLVGLLNAFMGEGGMGSILTSLLGGGAALLGANRAGMLPQGMSSPINTILKQLGLGGLGGQQQPAAPEAGEQAAAPAAAPGAPAPGVPNPGDVYPEGTQPSGEGWDPYANKPGAAAQLGINLSDPAAVEKLMAGPPAARTEAVQQALASGQVSGDDLATAAYHWDSNRGSVMEKLREKMPNLTEAQGQAFIDAYHGLPEQQRAGYTARWFG